MAKRTGRKCHCSNFKAQVAMEAIKGSKTIAELGASCGVHPSQVAAWKTQLVDGVVELFSKPAHVAERADEKLRDAPYQQIGQLQMEISWLKKALTLPVAQRRAMVEKDAEISMARQASLLGVNRSMLYYRPVPVSEVDDGLMKMIDRQYLATPFYGSRRMAEFLRRNDRLTNRKHVQRLMRLMGLEAIYPKPKTSLRDKQHEVYPYLLPDLPIPRSDHVWATDLTYIPMRRGLMYLMAIIDWFSRYVVAWGLSNTMDVAFCISVLNEALCRRRPDIFNSDQDRNLPAKHSGNGSNRNVSESTWTA